MDCEMWSALSEFERTSVKCQIITVSAGTPNYAKQRGRERERETERVLCLPKLIDASICNLLPLLITPPCPFSTSPHWASTELLSNEGKKKERKERKKSGTETHREITQFLLCYTIRTGTIVKVNWKNTVPLIELECSGEIPPPLPHEMQNNYHFHCHLKASFSWTGELDQQLRGRIERQTSSLERSVFALYSCTHKGKNTLLYSIFVCLAVYLYRYVQLNSYICVVTRVYRLTKCAEK